MSEHSQICAVVVKKEVRMRNTRGEDVQLLPREKPYPVEERLHGLVAIFFGGHEIQCTLGKLESLYPHIEVKTAGTQPT